MTTQYSSLAIPRSEDLIFGSAPRPVRCGFDLTIGNGLVYPEVNFTLPAITVNATNWAEVVAQYEQMIEAVVVRAAALEAPGIVVEFELLPAMTEEPEWGAEITALLRRRLQDAHERHGLRCALRVTPTDIRDTGGKPALRGGEPCSKLLRCFELCAAAGADILSIESVGGKEVHDQALVYGDVRGIVFALGVLAPRDVGWLWDRITEICGAAEGVVPGGDTACGFANTAMQLAAQKMLPEVLAAVVRAMSAVRSLAAFEHGAVGPSKDCAYEGPVLKVITGCPISMEGKSAACAHFSPLGNIAAAACDLWSNESVQNVRLLSGSAPEAFTELLIYDCRLMNAAARSGGALALREWLAESDRWLSPQAAVLSVEATYRIAEAVVSCRDSYSRTVAAGREAVRTVREGIESGRLQVAARERTWLNRIEETLGELPEDEDELLAEMREQYVDRFDPTGYGLG